MVILDLVWPALYIAKGIYQFWFLIFLTIAVEAFFIKYFLKIAPGKSLLISVAGNLSSSVAGTILMVFVSLLYHTVADTLFFKDTFNVVNWIASYLIMCFGSIFIEIIAVKLIWKFKFRELVLPLAIGNVVSYILLICLNNFTF